MSELTLRGIVLTLIFICMTMTSFIIFISEGSDHYGVMINESDAEAWSEIENQTEGINSLSTGIADNVKTISEVPVTGVVLIPSTLVKALLLPLESFVYMSVMVNNLNIGFPVYVIAAVEVAFLLLIAYLIIEAYLRHKGV